MKCARGVEGGEWMGLTGSAVWSTVSCNLGRS